MYSPDFGSCSQRNTETSSLVSTPDLVTGNVAYMCGVSSRYTSSGQCINSRLEAALYLYVRILFSPRCNTCCIDAGTERQIKQSQPTTTLQHPDTKPPVIITTFMLHSKLAGDKFHSRHRQQVTVDYKQGNRVTEVLSTTFSMQCS